MIGHVTFDKASMNVSLFLYSVILADKYDGKISRSQFGKEMAEFTGTPYMLDNGLENRTPYNKSKYPRYFGFLTAQQIGNDSYLCITKRGKRLLPLIDKNEDASPDAQFFISLDHRKEFRDMIMESVFFDSFGKNNCGAEQSKSDVEPPKVIFKTIYRLGKATQEEIAYVIFGFENNAFTSFDEAIDYILSRRATDSYDYSSIFTEWKVENKVNDFKLLRLFTNPSIGLIRESQDERIHKPMFSIDPDCVIEYERQLDSLSPVFLPTQMLVYGRSFEIIDNWLAESILGNVSEAGKTLFTTTAEEYNNTDHYGNTTLEQAIVSSFLRDQENIYFEMTCSSEAQLATLLADYLPLLSRTNDVISTLHGYSDTRIDASRLYQFISSQRIKSDTRALLQQSPNTVLFPSNLHLLFKIIYDGEVTEMDNRFDYVVKRTLVDGVAPEGGNAAGRNDNKDNGYNIILYGVPGCGKSFHIKDKYAPPEDCMERVAFHPDYSYSDFVGQLLPDRDEKGNIHYPFKPGPFTRILQKAVNETDESKSYYLIIEEINRGNAPAIFGDIFQLLDRRNGESEYAITNSDIAQFVYKDPSHVIRIPKNLFILATMNTADQNVFTLDTAFKRRWIMKAIPNLFDKAHCEFAGDEICGTGVTWEEFATKVNNKIIELNEGNLSSEDHRLGSHFITADELKDVERFGEKVLMYLWNDAVKYNRSDMFHDEYKTLDQLLDGFKKIRMSIFTFPFKTATRQGDMTEEAENTTSTGNNGEAE